MSDSGLANVNNLLFQTRYLGWDWDDFHDRFDEWRRTNRGCDRGQALEALGQLAADFSQAVRDIQGLSSGPVVRAMGDTLLQSVERKRVAVFSFRDD